MEIYKNRGGNIIMNLLCIDNLRQKQILKIFDLADKLKEKKHSQILKGKTFVLFFPESSIRTRISFEKGINDLGGQCILFPPTTLDKREDLEDVIKYIENWADLVIIRHPDYYKLHEIAKHSHIPIINAMTSENHPCEILSDLYSISKMRDDYRYLNYTFVGEKGNISRSWMKLAKLMNLKLNHVFESGNELRENDKNYIFHTELNKLLYLSDVILTDSLSSNLRKEDYIKKYQITLDRMEQTKKHSLLNPCPPFFRNEEVSNDVIDSKYFVGHKFKENLLYVQQAIILYCLGITSINGDMLNQKGFDLWANGYDKSVNLCEERNLFPFAGYKNVLNKIYNEIKKSYAKILDIGFGTGVLTHKLYNDGYNISGIDFSDEMIKIAKKKMPNANLIQWNFANGLPSELIEEKFDFIISTYAMHHLTDSEKISFIETLKTYLTDDGKILIGDIAFETRESLLDVKEKVGVSWDETEHYIVYNELVKGLDFKKVDFIQLSFCAGLMYLSK